MIVSHWNYDQQWVINLQRRHVNDYCVEKYVTATDHTVLVYYLFWVSKYRINNNISRGIKSISYIFKYVVRTNIKHIHTNLTTKISSPSKGIIYDHNKSRLHRDLLQTTKTIIPISSLSTYLYLTSLLVL